jgi:hypothetical protein
MIAIDTRIAELTKFIELAKDNSLTDETKAYLVRLGTVLICGHVERAIEIIVTTRLTKRAHPRVLSFIQSHFKRGRNMDCDAIAQLLNRFDPKWYRDFINFVEKNADVKEGISSCYSVRNSVAHGGNGSLGISRLVELLELSTKLIAGIIKATA